MLIGQKVSEWLNREQALDTATGVSGGAANTLPRMFFKDAGSGLHEFIQNATLQPDESVGGEPCQVITGDGHGGRLELWVTRKDLFLKQLQMVASGDGGMQEAGTSAARP